MYPAMELNYDEDVTENVFFRVLQDEHKEIFEKATMEGCVICVPRSGSLSKFAISLNDILSHILVPSDELPESHFRTLNEKDVKICNRIISVEHNDISRPYNTHILFEETFYTDDGLKYKVLCIERPLEMSGENVRMGIVAVQSLWDCIDLLWTESAGREVLEKIDELIVGFLSVNQGLELEPLQKLLDKTGSFYTQCLQVVMKDQRLREKCRSNSYMLDNVKLSVESYLHHGLYKLLIRGITACTAYEDASLNKIIRNMSDLQLQDLGVRSDLHDTVPKAKQELARIDCYSTALGKVGCLRRTFSAISKSNYGADLSEGNAIAADDILSMLVFLIIKAGLANWEAHLTFLKKFRFSSNPSLQTDEASFLITSLEAAIEHIKAGSLLGHPDPEAHHAYEGCLETDGFVIVNHKNKDSVKVSQSYSLGDLFDQAKLGDTGKVSEILDYCTVQQDYDGNGKLCHPLCSCDKCERELSKFQCETSPTIFTCDDRGFTVLHVACFYGQAKVVDLLLSRGAPVNTPDYSGSTPLHYASARGHQNALLLLVHAGANIQCKDNDGNTPLHLSVSNGHDACVKALLYFAEHVGVLLDINAINNSGDTPLHHAARWGYESIVRILLEYGADPQLENKRHLNSIQYSHSLHVARLLTSAVTATRSVSFVTPRSSKETSDVPIGALNKENLDFSDEFEGLNGATLENSCLRPRNVEQIRRVEKALNAVFKGDIPLACYYLGIQGPCSAADTSSVASLCHPLCVCEKCLPKSNSSDCSTSAERTMSVNVCNARGLTPLHIAAMKGMSEFIQTLLDAGALVNVQTKPDGMTPLHVACKEQRIESVKVLAQSAECKLDIQDSFGNTALHFACLAGGIRIAEILLKEGASPDVRNGSGQRPIDLAEEKMSLTLVKLLRGGKLLA